MLVGFVTAFHSKTNLYSAISLISENQSLGVIVDNQLYPLSNINELTPLLHRGEAPVSSTGYKYAILSNHQITETENFTRPSPSDTETNDYYGRSWNSYQNLTKLPTLLPPLPIIDRIQSDLHIENEIPTIHLYGNQSEINYIHQHQLDDKARVKLSMAYIRYKRNYCW